MEEQNKYYTPDWNELHLGDIIECWHSYDIPRFEHDIFNGWEIDTLKKYLADGAMRVKYLDQSDIESCGWVKDWDENSNYTGCYKLLVKSDINGQSDDNWELWQYDKIVSISNELSNRCFDGECKSINELKKIMQWLKIK